MNEKERLFRKQMDAEIRASIGTARCVYRVISYRTDYISFKSVN